MAGGCFSPAPQKLPQVSFVKVQEDGSTQPSGVHDLQARSYGYNDFSEFRRPEHYIRHIEPLESELAVQVEYDMDEQDQEWLDTVNAERKKEQLNKVTYEAFEIVMDRLEKEWFDLTKNIPKPDFAMPSEDSTCAICDDSEGENSNAIVFCDGCNLAVHQDCYGVPYIPEGQWLCRKCTVSPENPVSCILCPNEGGAFKQTVLGEWVHLLCAIWVPETRVANDVFMEPITGVDKISKQRWKLKCTICDIREGACIQCAKNSCFLAFHTTCARGEKLLMPMKSTQGAEAVTLMCFCEKHLPKEQLQLRNAAIASGQLGRINDHDGSPRLSKSARAYAKTYKPGPPLVPSIIVDRIMQYIGKVTIRKKQDFVILVCKYWSLKREARRGAPLLKRLHLEPWTASTGGKQQTEQEKTMKLELLQRLRSDLVSVQALTELSRKRESRKLKQAEIVQGILSRCLFAHEPPLRLAFERIMGLDRQDFFKNPVSKIEVPDYFDIIKKPMYWNIIDSKLDKHEYWDLQAFKDDVQLVLDNAMLYNKSGTPFYKAAHRIQASSQPIFQELDHLSARAAQQPNLSNGDHSILAVPQSSLIGDLEPPLELLELLSSGDSIKDGIDIVLNDPPLISLFKYEFAKAKPPPPPPTPPPSKRIIVRVPQRRVGRPKKEKVADGQVKAMSKATREVLDASPGFRAPRTRGALAAASESEASAGPSSVAEHQKLKRTPHVLPGQSNVPPMVDDVDNQGSFKMFNAGWILPPDQKRGGRAHVERTPLPPPRKRQRTDASGLSVYSTPAADNQILTTPAINEPQKQADSAMVVDTPADDSLTILARRKSRQKATRSTFPVVPAVPISSIVYKPDGTVIIEELDSPAIRRAKNLRRKAERLRLQADTSNSVPAKDDGNGDVGSELTSLSEPDSDEDPIAEQELPDGKQDIVVLEIVPPGEANIMDVDAGADDDEDMDADGDIDEEVAVQIEVHLPEEEVIQAEKEAAVEATEVGEVTAHQEDTGIAPSDVPLATDSSRPSRTPLKRRAHGILPVIPHLDPGALILPHGKMLDGGTLIWAKANSYPWWPAVIFEDDDEGVPVAVLKAKDKMLRNGKVEPLHLVRFFDKKSSWQWLELKDLKLLGEDKGLDEDLLGPTSRHQRWKNVKIRQECRKAYRDALAEMETDSGGDRAGDSGQQAPKEA